MHGIENVKFFNAQQAKKNSVSRISKKSLIKQMHQYGKISAHLLA